MSMNRREFMQMLAIASAAGMALKPGMGHAQTAADAFYDLPKFGNVHFLHFTDCHAQLKPIYFREPNVNSGFSFDVWQATPFGWRVLTQVLRH
jgi:S-sulfosulfanyl-L-cysteine sulfohydrolase